MPEIQTDIEKFDRAVYAYLSTISTKVVYAPTQTALRTITKKENFSDKKPWNFISFHRSPSFEINWSRMNNPATVTGDYVRKSPLQPDIDPVDGHYVHNIPVNLTYEIEIWASKATEVLALSTALISKIFMEEQVLHVPIDPDADFGRFHILDVSWTDNSDLERETEIGKIYRHSISFTIDARVLLVREVSMPPFAADVMPEDIYENT